jgi:hypothetical protein
MSGSRCKMLRAAFVATHGRSPRKTASYARPIYSRLGRWLRDQIETASEWRQLKRAWTLRLRRGLA